MHCKHDWLSQVNWPTRSLITVYVRRGFTERHSASTTPPPQPHVLGYHYQARGQPSRVKVLEPATRAAEMVKRARHSPRSLFAPRRQPHCEEVAEPPHRAGHCEEVKDYPRTGADQLARAAGDDRVGQEGERGSRRTTKVRRSRLVFVSLDR